MTTGIVPQLWETGLARSQYDHLHILHYALTAGSGVNSAALVRSNQPARALCEGGTGSALTSITQATVDALLGSVNEIIVTTAFGTTAMVDNDTYALVLDCGGQVRDVGFAACLLSIAGAGTFTLGTGTYTALTNATFTGVQTYVTALGNIGARVTLTNAAAAATAGFLTWIFGTFNK